MIKHELGLHVALVLLCGAFPFSSAFGLPPPMSAQDLVKNSDLVATIKVLGVACAGQAPFETTGRQTTRYRAWMQLVAVKKGSLKAGETLLVQWQDTPKGLLGPWSVEYLPGEEAETHLTWNEKEKAYETTWWNAKAKSSKPADAGTLPQKAGEVRFARNGSK